MNNTFSFSRFGKYFKYDFLRWISSCGLPVLMTSLMPVILYAIIAIYGLVFKDGFEAPGITVRAFVAFFATIVLVITYPAAMYGFITDKKAGSMFLMLPVSVAEKFASMILNTVILLPVMFGAVYFISDAIICLLDPSCGGTLFASAADMLKIVFRGAWSKEVPISVSMYSLLANFASCLLFFLLGAVLFKKHKKFYPILILIGIQMLLSLLVGVLVAAGLGNPEFMEGLSAKFVDHTDAIEGCLTAFNVFSFCWDTLVIVGLGAAVFFRVKTLKH